jgi:Protein of unknown function (DUF1573)
MKKEIFTIVFLLFSSVAIYAQDKPTLSNVGNDNPNQPSFKFNEDEFNFGNIMQGEKAQHEFEFINNGKEPLVITSASGSCGCTVPVWPKEPIMGGAKGVIKVTFDSAGKQGIQDKTVTLQSNAKQNPMVLHLKGNVDKPIEQPGAKTNTDGKK